MRRAWKAASHCVERRQIEFFNIRREQQMHHHRLGHWKCEGLRRSADGRTLRASSTFSFAPITETRSIDGGSVDFWSLSKAKVFRFPFCSALAHFPLSLALTGSPACLHACLPARLLVLLFRSPCINIGHGGFGNRQRDWSSPFGIVLNSAVLFFLDFGRRQGNLDGLHSSFLPRTERTGKERKFVDGKAG